MQLPVYLDHPSTTPCDRRALEAMLPYFSERFGHPASRQHHHGADAAQAVAHARSQVAELLGADPEEVVFTSGGTEADNLAIRGTAAARGAKGDHLVSTGTEHRAAMDALRRLENEGFRVTYVPVGGDGVADPAAVAAAISERTVLVSVMAANHETGVVQPTSEIARFCAERNVAFHVNAVQAAAVLPLCPDALGADLLSLSAHKMYGPKGVGALYVRRRGRRARLSPLLEGGGHERGLRPGTVPVPLVVGFGAAAEIVRRELASDASRIAGLREKLLAALRSRLPELLVNGDPQRRLPGILNVSIPYVEAESLLLAVRDSVSASSGSGCTSDSPEPSYVLQAMGLESLRLPSSIRLGLGRATTDQDVEFAAEAIAQAARRLRSKLP